MRAAPAHSGRPPASLRPFAAVVGGLALLVGVGLGTAALLRSPDSGRSTPESARLITAPQTPFVRSVAQIESLLHKPPDYGPLRDSARRASCLAGLGYRAGTTVLAAEPIEVGGERGVLLVFSDEGADAGSSRPHGTSPLAEPAATGLVAVVVAERCSAADTGLLAETTLARPPS